MHVFFSAMEPMVIEPISEISNFAGPLVNFFANLSAWLVNRRIELLYFAIGIAVSLLTAFFVSWVFRKVLGALVGRSRNTLDDDLVKLLHAPIVTMVLISGVVGSAAILRIPASVMTVVYKLYYAAATLTLVWGLLRLIGCFNAYFKSLASRSNSTLDDLLIDLIRRVVKVSLWVIALLFIAQNIFSLNVSAMLAGAGVVGLAVAFAAQNTIANIFGAITLIVDKPFTVGDRVVVGGRDGLVEAVGLRSTSLRALDGTQWSIPNKEMAESAIQNFSQRPNFKHVFDIGLVYDTPPDRMKLALAIMHEIMDSDASFVPGMPPRINFVAMKDWSLNIQAIVWFNTTDYFEMLGHCERLNFMILERFNAEGLEFAFPSTTAYIAGDAKRPLLTKSIEKA